jgi:hypothetical protein
MFSQCRISWDPVDGRDKQTEGESRPLWFLSSCYPFFYGIGRLLLPHFHFRLGHFDLSISSGQLTGVFVFLPEKHAKYVIRKYAHTLPRVLPVFFQHIPKLQPSNYQRCSAYAVSVLC